jgi:hypothetical protein
MVHPLYPAARASTTADAFMEEDDGPCVRMGACAGAVAGGGVQARVPRQERLLHAVDEGPCVYSVECGDVRGDRESVCCGACCGACSCCGACAYIMMYDRDSIVYDTY